MITKVLFFLVALVSLGVIAGAMMGWMSGRGSAPGLTTEGQLAPCPSSPNCISSEPGTPESHATTPLPPVAGEEIKRAMAMIGGVQTAEDGNYLAFTVKTPIFGFIDDVEFRMSAEGTHVRSASRIGHSDLGANAKRVAKLRDMLRIPGTE